jgi:hypothetical protein
MAYMDQEKKAKISAELKKVIPADWKYSLSVQHHSSITLTISAAPVDLIGENLRPSENKGDYIQLNEYYLEREYSGELLPIFEAIKAAMNFGNHDNSDITTDHFDVGHYAYVHIGRWNKPFVCTESAVAA